MHSSKSARTRARGGQAISASREQNSEQHAQPVGHFFNLYVGLNGPGWLYVLGMPTRGYLPIFATLNPQSTCHGPQPGPKHAQWCSGGFPACPGAESTRKDPAGRQKHVDAQKKHLCIRNVYLVPGIKKGNNGHKKPTVARPYGGSTAPMNQRTTSAM